MVDTDSDSEGDLGFANLDLTGVNFDDPSVDPENSTIEEIALAIELASLGGSPSKGSIATADSEQDSCRQLSRLREVVSLVENGKYVEALRGTTGSSHWLLSEVDASTERETVWTAMRTALSKIQSLWECVEAEFLGIAAFNLFLQLNYTGPAIDDLSTLEGVNPHDCFTELLNFKQSEKTVKITQRHDVRYHNRVLADLAVDGLWPCQVVEAPYLLLFARCVLLTLSDPEHGCWTEPDGVAMPMPPNFVAMTSKLSAVTLWSGRAAVAHERLLDSQEPTLMLWKEVETTFPRCMSLAKGKGSDLEATVLLEFGLACYHFDRPARGKELFLKAKETTKMELQVTGAQGRRTKFQQKATAQLVVNASSATHTEETSSEVAKQVKAQLVNLAEDSILHDAVQFEDEEANRSTNLTVLDQAIVLALCLDIKRNNPADGLTGEEMSAFLARVLHHHDDWIVYSTALLERAWLEFEGNHTKERAILQMQALADQHTERLTLTQSTRQSVEDSSPVQERIKNVHTIVYPPRWEMLRDVAERYAVLGVVTSAAEIFAEVGSWDEAVDCYRRGGKEKRAEEVVRERLSISETPRMLTALGDITKDPSYYDRAIQLSKGRFCQAYMSMGKHHFDKEEMRDAADNYRKALKLRPLLPAIWFRLGTISMQLGDWEAALTAFSEVVQQQPDEAEAWANVAAVHMQNKRPSEAYPALNESLKHNRSNWRVWVSKLYTCLDMEKFDEATQACTMLLDLRTSKSSQGVPELEEKCVRAIVGGSIQIYEDAQATADEFGLESARRTLGRVHELLERLRTSLSHPWVFETTAYFHEQVGRDEQVYQNLMKEYRALSAVRAWEKDDRQVKRVCQVVTQIVHYQRGNREELEKSRFLLSGVLKRVKQARADQELKLEFLNKLDIILEEVTEKIDDFKQDSATE